MLSRQLVYVQRGARLKKNTKAKRKQVKVTPVTKIKYQRYAYDKGYLTIPHKCRHEDKR